MRYCTRCLYPENHPYGMIFDEKGVCAGCRVHEEKDELNWDKRFEDLKKIVKEYKKNRVKGEYDCIIPVTGGGDSYFIVHVVKNVLELNPLLVNYNSQYNTAVGIRNLANVSNVFDCDIYTSTVSPATLKKVTRSTLKLFGSMYWQVLAGYLTFPVQVASQYKIPLIFWGVQSWSEQTGMFSHLDEVEMTERCRWEHPLMGWSNAELKKADPSLTNNDLQAFEYPNGSDISSIGIRGIYLSNYLRWDSKTQHELMIKLYGYESCKQKRTFNTYEDVHCHHSAGLHDYLKFLKLGYSKVHDHACREIRLRRMTREEGIAMVKAYAAERPADLPLFLNWLEISEEQFWDNVWNRRDRRIWGKQAGNWELLDSIENHVADAFVDDVRLPNVEGGCHFQITPSLEPELRDTEYILMGRSYLDKLNFGSLKDKPAKGIFTERLTLQE